jgi:hypothetical protein
MLTLDWGNGIAVDPSDNVFVTGEFSGSIDFDPGPGVDIHTSQLISGNSYYSDAFVSKFDSDGNYLWGRNWSIFREESGQDAATDAFGNVYVFGDADMWYINAHGAGTYQYLFLRKLDSSGNLQWQDMWGQNGSYLDCGSVAVDNAGNAIITGSFYEVKQIDLDPGPGVDIHTTASDNDCFLVEVDSAGTYQWGRNWASTPIFGSRKLSHVSDAAGNIYVAGAFTGTVDFDPGDGVDIHSSYGMVNAFLCKYSPYGAFEWARTWIEGGFDKADQVVVGNSGNLYVTYEHMSAARQYALRMLDSNGNMQWERTWDGATGNGMLGGNDMCRDRWDNIFIVGELVGSADTNPGPQVDIHTGYGQEGGDAFILKVTADGYW